MPWVQQHREWKSEWHRNGIYMRAYILLAIFTFFHRHRRHRCRRCHQTCSFLTVCSAYSHGIVAQKCRCACIEPALSIRAKANESSKGMTSVWPFFPNVNTENVFRPTFLRTHHGFIWSSCIVRALIQTYSAKCSCRARHSERMLADPFWIK